MFGLLNTPSNDALFCQTILLIILKLELLAYNPPPSPPVWLLATVQFINIVVSDSEPDIYIPPPPWVPLGISSDIALLLITKQLIICGLELLT